MVVREKEVVTCLLIVQEIKKREKKNQIKKNKNKNKI